jgi:hypothetical protein
VGGTGRFGSFLDAPKEIPTTDRLVLTNLVDNICDVYAKGGKIGNLTITRNALPHPYGSELSLLSEHGLAFHLKSFRGAEEKQILLDFALTPHTPQGITEQFLYCYCRVEQRSAMLDCGRKSLDPGTVPPRRIFS